MSVTKNTSTLEKKDIFSYTVPIRVISFKIINSVLLLQLIILPLMIVELSIVFVIFNRFIFFMVGVVALYYISKIRYKNQLFSPPYVFLVLVIYVFYGCARSDTIHYFFYEGVINGLTILMGAALVIWSMNAKLINFPKYFSILLIAYSLDVIFQSIYGVNILGIEPPIYGRNWGMFVYGAPTAGIYISMMFFVPWFWLKGPKLVMVYCLVIVALFLSNDRGPILQIMAILFIYSFIYHFKLTITLFVFFIVFVINFDFSYEYLPHRIGMLFKLLSHIMDFGVNDLISNSSVSSEYSIQAYIAKYVLIYNGWFSFDNIWNLLFGTGIGITSIILEQYTGVGRPHSNVLEFIITFGLLYSTYFIILVMVVIKRTKKISIVIMPALFPFSFQSLYSFNWFILFIAACLVMIYSYKTKINQNHFKLEGRVVPCRATPNET
jgi:hypothetical protein